MEVSKIRITDPNNVAFFHAANEDNWSIVDDLERTRSVFVQLPTDLRLSSGFKSDI